MPRGLKNPRFSFQVDMDVESLNQQECFVLDMGDKIYLYQGTAATPFDKTAASNFGDYLEKSKNGAATLEEADEHFWKLLNGTVEEVRGEVGAEGGEDGDGAATPGGAAFIDDGNGWSRAGSAQIDTQLARLAAR